MVTPFLDALRQRHGLRGRLLLGAIHCALRITAGALEGAVLETRAIRIQEACHALAEALGLRAMAHVFAGRAVATEIGGSGAKQGYRTLRSDALRHGGSQRTVRLLHARQEAFFIATRATQRTGLSLRAIIVTKACIDFACAFFHAACTDVLARRCTAVHRGGDRGEQVVRTFAVDALQERRRK